MGLQITPMAGLCLLMFLSYPLPPPLYLTPGSADNAYGRTLLILVLGTQTHRSADNAYGRTLLTYVFRLPLPSPSPPPSPPPSPIPNSQCPL